MTTQRRSKTRHTRAAGIQTAAGADIHDPNLAAAALLYDMASLQSAERSAFGFKRAAKAIIGLPVAVSELVAAGSLSEVPFIGPSSTRIVTEYVESGRSATVDKALERSAKASQVAALRELRSGFLSQFAMQHALAAPLAKTVVRKEDFRGDFQMHSTWSDGGERIGTLADACMTLGHTCMGVTDHSYGLPIARGMSMTAVVRQQEEIDDLNAGFGDRFRIFKGIEANILADGALDLQPDERRRFEFVVASPHSLLRRREDQTSRMLAAVRAEGVAILGHPRGRIFNSRAGVIADWTRIFDAAAERDVAIELDGNWHRQDLDFRLAAQAVTAGCIFALDSDAHSIGELRFTDYAIAHARLARIPSHRVINCWTNDRLARWMDGRRAGTR